MHIQKDDTVFINSAAKKEMHSFQKSETRNHSE